MKIAVFPGTFDPVTHGHFDIMCRASKIVDKLIIGIASSNRKNPIFSEDERMEMINQQIKNRPELKNVEVKIFHGLLVDFMKKEGAKINIRGLRVASDFTYEFQMSCINKKLDNDIETIFLAAIEENQFISSTFVKEVAALGGDIKKFLPKEIAELLLKKMLLLNN
jgi:pantetheine-phosphate adenylyltransferase